MRKGEAFGGTLSNNKCKALLNDKIKKEFQ